MKNLRSNTQPATLGSTLDTQYTAAVANHDAANERIHMAHSVIAAAEAEAIMEQRKAEAVAEARAILEAGGVI